jgi:hypothetical protein
MFDCLRLALMQSVLVFTPTSEILSKTQSIRLDNMPLFRWQARPWYRPEVTGLGYYKDKFLVFIGWHSEMPGPQWVPCIPASWFFALDSPYFLNSLKSSGYRLEEMVCGFGFYERNLFYWLAVYLSGSFKVRKWCVLLDFFLSSYNLILCRRMS